MLKLVAMWSRMRLSQASWSGVKFKPAFALRVKTVSQEGFVAGALVAKRQRIVPRGQSCRHAGDILGGLFLDAGQGDACGLGLNRSDRLAIYKQRVVRLTGREGEFADSDPWRGGQINSIPGLNDPAGCAEQRIDLLPGSFLGSHRPLETKMVSTDPISLVLATICLVK